MVRRTGDRLVNSIHLNLTLDLPPVEHRRPNLVGPGRGVPPIVMTRPPLEIAKVFRTRGIDEAKDGNRDAAKSDFFTADQIEASTPVDGARFQHRVTAGNRFHNAGLHDLARDYRAHTIRLFDGR